MPTYEYECSNCGHHFEKFQMMNDERLKTCPKCHKSVRRLIGAGSGIIFKGAGFYATDYRKTKPSPVPKKASESSSVSAQAGSVSGSSQKSDSQEKNPEVK